MISDEMVETLARKLCAMDGADPDSLEAGSAYGIDGELPNGDPGFYYWRLKASHARSILCAIAPVIRAAALEEAAKVALGEMYGFAPDQLTEHGVGYERACKDIADAIRALKEPT
jgi:hypothetical protein